MFQKRFRNFQSISVSKDGARGPGGLSNRAARVSGLRLGAVALLALCCVTSSPSQQTGPRPAQGAPVKSAQSHGAERNPQLRSPFDRVIAPLLARQWSAAGRSTARAAVSAAQGSTGSSVNFPGFVAAPFLSFDQGDSSPAYASVSGDFNGDGYADIASLQTDGTLNIVLNPGAAGSLATATPLAPNKGAVTANFNRDMFWLQAADLNGDGKLDLIGEDIYNTQFLVWMGNGDGTFLKPVVYKVTPSNGASWFLGGGFLAVGDFNGDGAIDLAAVFIGSGFKTSTVTVLPYLNDGKGNLTAGKESDSTLNDYYSAPWNQGDVVWNGAKVAGIVALVQDDGFQKSANSGLDLLVIGSNGDGTFAPAVEPAAPLLPDYANLVEGSVVATSLASKGGSGTTTDIVFSVGDGAVYDAPYAPGSGSSALSKATLLVGANAELLPNHQRYNPQVQRNAAAGPSLTSSPIPFQSALQVADVNGDGYGDLVVYNSGSVDVYLNSGTGAFLSAPVQLAGGLAAWEQPKPADFDHSGNMSLVEIDSQLNQLGLYVGNGAGAFFGAPAVSGFSTNGGGSYEALGGNIDVEATGDFNGDGILDVVALDWSNYGLKTSNGYPDIVLGINQGKKTLANEADGFAFSTVLSGAAFSSLNGAYVEPVTFAAATGGQTVLIAAPGQILATTGVKGVFGKPVALLPPGLLNCTPNLVDVGDLNGDGIPDIVVPYPGDASCGGSGHMPSGVWTLLGAKDGTFSPGFLAFGSSLYQAKLIDFNGDGSPDLALVDSADVYILPNLANGSGGFNTSKASDLASGYIVSDIIAGDFNADGKQDLTLATEGLLQPGNTKQPLLADSWGVIQAPGNGDFTFGTPTTVDVGYFPEWGSYADFNGDGLPDLALAEYGDTATIENPAGGPYIPGPPIVHVLPNLGGGVFGDPISEFDSFFDDVSINDVKSYSLTETAFTGNFGSGGQDLLVSGYFDSALFLNQGADTLALTSSATSASQGTNVTLTATLTQPVGNLFTPTGTVTFYENGTVLGIAEIASTGSAIFSTNQLLVGTDAIRAVYAGDAHYNAASAAGSVTVLALAPGFTLSATPTTLTLAQGATGVATLTLAANATFNGSVSVTCSGAPAESSCTVNPASATLSAGQTGTVTVVIATTAKGSAYQALNRGREGLPWLNAAGGVSLAGALLWLAPRRRRWNRLGGLIAFAVLGAGCLAMVTGCGSGGGNTGTPVGTSTITITATSGGLTQTQTIALTITKPQ